MTFCARILTWDESRLERASVDGKKDADAANMDVNKNDDWARTNDTV